MSPGWHSSEASLPIAPLPSPDPPSPSFHAGYHRWQYSTALLGVPPWTRLMSLASLLLTSSLPLRSQERRARPEHPTTRDYLLAPRTRRFPFPRCSLAMHRPKTSVCRRYSDTEDGRVPHAQFAAVCYLAFRYRTALPPIVNSEFAPPTGRTQDVDPGALGPTL
ncbi:hypothetical protein L226DRAFT_231242 [Lentinus tigrinus ALCF2SS1-7]|uniref:uncharacterized protein n=1 Tax=Lentinus tigrinus ALCF2SS1-7 TaxID=1328758 RepID=UPI00116623FE|nr:hypothetical protein L226DRAFT_231242 [Lentinus tigrinus ALCF2SS1-7]